MAESYSTDLRKRVIAYVEGGHSRREAGRRFDVSASFAVKAVARWRDTGSVAPAQRGRPKGNGKLAPFRAFLIGRVEACPDITMPELAAELEVAHQVKAAPAVLSRFLCRAGFTYKKNSDGGGARTRRGHQRPAVVDTQPSTPDAS
jgi:transposase